MLMHKYTEGTRVASRLPLHLQEATCHKRHGIFHRQNNKYLPSLLRGGLTVCSTVLGLGIGHRWSILTDGHLGKLWQHPAEEFSRDTTAHSTELEVAS